MASLLDSVDIPEDEDVYDRDFRPEFTEEFRPAFSDLEQDPAPGAPAGSSIGRRAASKLKPPTGPPASAAFKRRVSAELQVYMELLAGTISIRDEICGTAFSDNAKEACDRIAAILCRYPDLAQKIVSSGMLGDLVGLGLVASRIGRVIAAHHVTKTIGNDESGDDLDDELYPPYRPH